MTGPCARLESKKLPSALLRTLVSPASQTPLSLASTQTLAFLNTEATVLEGTLAARELAITGGV